MTLQNTSKRLILLALLFIFGLQQGYSQCAGDVTPPVAICQNSTVYLDVTGTVTVFPSDIDGGSTDNCGIDSMLIDTTHSITYTCADIGIHSAVLVVRDSSNNASFCSAQITVLDTIPPSVTCQNTTANLDITGNASITSLDVVDVGTSATFDNCGIFNFTINGGSPTTYDCDSLGNRQVVVTAEDFSGNTSSCVATVNVVETILPTAVCTTYDAYLNNAGTVTVFPPDIDGGSTDNCGIVSYLIDGQVNKTFACSDVGPNSVTLTVTDVNGNTNSCVTTVNVLDTIPPVASCNSIYYQNNNPLYLDANGMVIATPADIDRNSFDNCTGFSSMLINGQASDTFTCADAGIKSMTLTVTDSSGNTATCNAEMAIKDTLGNCPFEGFVYSVLWDSCDNVNCTGGAWVDVSGGQPPFSFLWNDGNTDSLRTNMCPGNYSVIASDTLQVTINNLPGCVWPSDTDDNALANNFDLLPITTAYGATGLARPNASLVWQAQPAPD